MIFFRSSALMHEPMHREEQKTITKPKRKKKRREKTREREREKLKREKAKPFTENEREREKEGRIKRGKRTAALSSDGRRDCAVRGR